MSSPKKHGFGTLAVHAGSPFDPATGAVIESVSVSRSQKHDCTGCEVQIQSWVT